MRRAHDIPAALINLRIGVAQQLGGDRTTILKEAGIQEETLSDPTNRVSVTDTMNVWQAILNQTDSHDIGLISGSRMRLSSLGILGYLTMNSENIGKAIEKLCTYQRLVSSIAFINPVKGIATVKYELELKEDWIPLFRYTIDFMIAALSSIFLENTHSPVLPKEVGFTISSPENVDTYNKLFSPAKVHFGCDHTYIVYSSQDLSSKIIGANSDLFNYFQKELDEAVISHDKQLKYTRQVRELIQKKMKADLPRLEDVARDVGVSTRSLQELLKSEATSFRTLLNEVRKEIAMKQLKNKNFNVTEVAFLTGFSDIAVFSRSFKKWTGLSPSQYQLQH